MMKRLLSSLSFLTVLLMPDEGRLDTLLLHGEYAVTVRGHYTDRDQLTAAGVFDVKWQSDKPEKSRAEMLGLRTAFVEWFVAEWVKQGGSRKEAIDAIRGYPFR